MAKLPHALGFLRPWIHKARLGVQKSLGINLPALPQPGEVFDSELMMRLSDRIAILESQVNWRLYGLPSRVENVKLEQVRLLSASGDVEWAIAGFEKNRVSRFTGLPAELSGGGKSGSVFVSDDSTGSELRALMPTFANDANFAWVDDPNDLYSVVRKSAVIETGKVTILKASIHSAIAKLAEGSHDYVWLSSAIERATPIQGLILMRRACLGLAPGGRCAGYFEDYLRTEPGLYWADPRRTRAITAKYVEHVAKIAGFKSVKLIRTDQPGPIFFLASR